MSADAAGMGAGTEYGAGEAALDVRLAALAARDLSTEGAGAWTVGVGGASIV